jgi:hypothetical protein
VRSPCDGAIKPHAGCRFHQASGSDDVTTIAAHVDAIGQRAFGIAKRFAFRLSEIKMKAVRWCFDDRTIRNIMIGG